MAWKRGWAPRLITSISISLHTRGYFPRLNGHAHYSLLSLCLILTNVQSAVRPSPSSKGVNGALLAVVGRCVSDTFIRVETLHTDARMHVTSDDVDRIDAVRELVVEIIDYAEDHPDSVFELENLYILEAQLDALHQGLSLVVAAQSGDDNA